MIYHPSCFGLKLIRKFSSTCRRCVVEQCMIGPMLNCYAFRAHLDFFISRKIHGCAGVRILNGTSTALLDTRTGNSLSKQGVAVREFGDTKDTNRTTIILYSPKLYTLRYLMEIFGITNSTPIRIQPDPSQTVDIEIRLGTDWVKKLPDGY